MLWEQKEPSISIDIPDKLHAGLQVLHEAFGYAHDVGSKPWEFAISMFLLEKHGFNPSDVRWLTLKGLIEHAREVTVEGDDGRRFRATGNLTFCECTCVVLTDVGANLAEDLLANKLQPASVFYSLDAVHTPSVNEPQGTITPNWDPQLRRLSFNGKLVKRFKWPAANQEAILSAFQEENWPERIDDPIPPHHDQDPKRRLADTIKCLNRKQPNELIHFRGDGTGEGVTWEYWHGDTVRLES